MAERDFRKGRLDTGVCPVCDGKMGRCFRVHGLFRSFVDTQASCECGLYRLFCEPGKGSPLVYKFREQIVCAIWPYDQRDAPIAEARRLHAEDWESHAQYPEDVADHTAWMVYADWLDENGFPCTARAVRLKHGELCGTASDKAE